MKFLTGGYHHPFIPISNSHIVPKYATSPPSKLWFMSGVEHERGDDFRNPTNAAAVRGSIDYLELQVDYDSFFFPMVSPLLWESTGNMFILLGDSLSKMM